MAVYKTNVYRPENGTEEGITHLVVRVQLRR